MHDCEPRSSNVSRPEPRTSLWEPSRRSLVRRVDTTYFALTMRPARLPGGGDLTNRNCGEVRVQISDPTLTHDLVDFLRRRECRAERIDQDVIEIEAHPTLSDEKARLELDLLLRVWQSLHPGVELRPPRPRRRRRST
jgi:hypothetical protein